MLSLSKTFIHFELIFFTQLQHKIKLKTSFNIFDVNCGQFLVFTLLRTGFFVFKQSKLLDFNPPKGLLLALRTTGGS